MPQYRTRYLFVEATQLEDTIALSQMVDGEMVTTSGVAGDWIVIKDGLKISIMTDEDFMDEYERVS